MIHHLTFFFLFSSFVNMIFLKVNFIYLFEIETLNELELLGSGKVNNWAPSPSHILDQFGILWFLFLIPFRCIDYQT